MHRAPTVGSLVACLPQGRSPALYSDNSIPTRETMALFAKNRRFFGLLRTALFVLFIISLLNPAMAGEYHASEVKTTSGITTIACSQCHTMHGTQGGVSMIYSGGGSGPQTKLLRFNSILGLCLYCHDGDNASLGAPDIRAAPAAGQVYVPSAGRFSDRGYENYSNMHDVGVAVPTPPGYAGTWTDVTDKFGSTFNCIYCHDNHGNNNYRNLRYDPGNPANDNSASGVKVTYMMSGQANCSDDSSTPCSVEQTVATGMGLGKYERKTVTFIRAPLDADSPKQGVAAWCGRCHVNFYGISGAANVGGIGAGGLGSGDNNSGATSPWIRHPVQDINISLAVTNLHADSTLWDAATSGDVRHINPDGTPFNDDEQPFCFSCHYAHGGGNPNNAGDPTLDHTNLVQLDSAYNINLCPSAVAGSNCTAEYVAATGMMRNTCLKCHNQ